MTKHTLRPVAVAVLVVGLGLSGCSTIADLDPTGLLSDDSTPAETQFPTDSQQQAQADATTTTPDLASIPTRPPTTDTATTANTTQQVAAAGTQAQYSGDALRAGTEAAAPPPAAADAKAARAALAASDTPPTASDTAPPMASTAPPMANNAPPTASDAPPTASAPPPGAVAVAAPPGAAPPPVMVAPEPPVPPVTRAATMAPPPGTEPAVPAAMGPRMAMVNPSDAQLGFKPSSAPPLNPSISQWVAPPILAHYRQTASAAGISTSSDYDGSAAVPAVAPRQGYRGRRAMGGPAMSGDVVANLDAVPGTPAGMAASMNGGVPPTAIVYFPGDTTALPASAMAKVREAAAAFQAGGGAGSVKVVGHASSRTANMPVERHLEVIFQKSQSRADAVAQALIRAGVPADRVQIEAVGDSQPVYYESMPKGEDGNRRAEIFVQG